MNKNRGRVQKAGTCRRTKKKFVRFSSGLIALMFLISTVSTGLAFGHRVLGSSLLTPAGGENGLVISCADVTEGNAVVPRIEKNISGQSVTFTYKGLYELSYSASVPVKAGAYTVCGVTPATDTYPSYTATASFTIVAAAPAQTADSTTADTAAQASDSTAADAAAQASDSTAADTAAQATDSTAAAQASDSTTTDTAAQAADSTAADTTAQTTDSTVQDASDSSAATSSEDQDNSLQTPAGAAEAEKNAALPPATAVVFPESLEMEHAAALSTLPITDCSGDGVFTWADASFVPAEKETACDIIFIPNDSVSYDYSAVKGWDAEKQTVTQSVTVRITGSVDASPAEEEAVGDEKDSAVLDDEAIAAAEKLLKNEDGSASDSLSEKNSDTADVIRQEQDGKLDADTVSGAKLSDNKDKSSKKQENLADAAASADTTVPDNKIEQEPVDGTDYAVAETARMLDALPTEIAGDGEVSRVVEAAAAYNLLTSEQQLSLSDQTVAKLVAAQQAAAVYNHSSQGVTVSGDAIKWYIQLRVQMQNDTSAYETPNIDTLIAPYELTLWNLLTDTEYELPEGARVQITMPVPNVEEYDHLVIVHYRDGGEMEYITPTVEDETLTFETDSFSPFDIAGSKVLVGGSAIAQNYSSTTNTLSSSTGSTGSTSSSNTGSNTGLNSSTGSGYGYGTGSGSSSGSSYQTGTYSAVTTTTAVWTGDNVDISIYLIIGGISFVMAMGMMGYNIHQNLMIKRKAKTKAWRNGIHE